MQPLSNEEWQRERRLERMQDDGTLDNMQNIYNKTGFLWIKSRSANKWVKAQIRPWGNTRMSVEVVYPHHTKPGKKMSKIVDIDELYDWQQEKANELSNSKGANIIDFRSAVKKLTSNESEMPLANDEDVISLD